MSKKILVVLAGSILIVGGVFWFTKKEQTSNTIPVVKTFEAVQGEPDHVWFPVSELGIEVKVRKDIASELLYKVVNGQSEKDILSAEFTTKKLVEIGEKNGIVAQNQSGRYNCTLGVFTRYNMPEKEYIAMQEETYGEGSVAPTSVGGYFVQYATPQSSCSFGQNGLVQADADYEEYLNLNWLKRMDGIQVPVKELVRRIQ